MSRERQGRVVGPDFEARFSSNGVVTKTDAQIAFMQDWADQRVRDYCQRRGWKLSRILTQIERAEKDPLVMSVLAAFPGAEVVGVSDLSDVW